jgi:hypothetical protein
MNKRAILIAVLISVASGILVEMLVRRSPAVRRMIDGEGCC